MYKTGILIQKLSEKLNRDSKFIENLYIDFFYFIHDLANEGYIINLKNIGTFTVFGNTEKLNTSDLIKEYTKTRNYSNKFILNFIDCLYEAILETFQEGYGIYLPRIGLLSYNNYRIKFNNSSNIIYKKSTSLSLEEVRIQTIDWDLTEGVAISV